MKKVLLAFCILLSIVSCTTIKETPIEATKTKYITVHIVDTIIQNNTKYIKEKGDTIYIYEKEYLYKYRDRVDTLIVNDTTLVYKDRIEYKEVNIIKDWQYILMLLGGGVLALLLYKLVMLIKKWLM